MVAIPVLRSFMGLYFYLNKSVQNLFMSIDSLNLGTVILLWAKFSSQGLLWLPLIDEVCVKPTSSGRSLSSLHLGFN